MSEDVVLKTVEILNKTAELDVKDVENDDTIMV
jgi:hypothetical protein